MPVKTRSQHLQSSNEPVVQDITEEMAVTLTDDQFQQLLARLQMQPTTSNSNSPSMEMLGLTGNFAKCTSRFAGTVGADVEAFINAVEVYKDCCNVSDENALRGLTMLLTDLAATWWLGVRGGFTTWQEAVKELRTAFGKKKPAYQLYRDLFASVQSEEEKTDLFVCKCRAILADIPDQLSEKVQLDMVYGLLHLRIRQRVLREQIASFSELINLARSVEDSLMEETLTKTADPKTNSRPRCGYCKKDTHLREECPKLQQKQEDAPEHGTSEGRKKINCYGCGAEGVIKSKCQTCQNRTSSNVATVSGVHFSTLTEQDADQRPVVPVHIRGKLGTAILDSGAQRCIAGHQLYQLLKKDGCEFTEETVTVAYADGVKRRESGARTEVEIVISNRTISISMLAFPNITTNRTLLGIDFMHKAGIILDSARKTWYFSDDTRNHHPYNVEEVDENSMKSALAAEETKIRELEAELKKCKGACEALRRSMAEAVSAPMTSNVAKMEAELEDQVHDLCGGRWTLTPAHRR